MTDPVLLIPKRKQGSRQLNGTNQYFTAATRAMSTNDIAVCGWLYCDIISQNNAILHNYSAGGVWVGSAGQTLRVSARVGGSLATANSGNVVVAGVWNFVVVNFDRSGNALGYINDMSSAAVTLDISADVAVDWGSGLNPWRLGRDGAHLAHYTDGRLSRLGVIIGDLLTEDDRNELYNTGRGLRFHQLSAGLATKFGSQDYWDFYERAGNAANQATALRVATAVNSPTFAGPPKR